MICEHCREPVIKAPAAWIHAESVNIWCDPSGEDTSPLKGKQATPTEEPLDAVVRGWNDALNRAKDETDV